MKTCSKCKEDKPVDQFRAHPNTKDRKRPECKQCCAARDARWRSENRDNISEKRRTRYQENREQRIAYARERRRKYPAKQREIDARAYLRKRDGDLLRRREHYATNKGEERLKRQEWRARNKDKHRASVLAAKDRAQAETAALATRRRAPWEPWEDAMVLGSSESVKAIAIQLGRTYSSVAQRRRRLTQKALESLNP